MKNRIHILSTATLSETQLNRLADNNIETEIHPFIRTTTALTTESRQRIHELEKHSCTVVFTSANGVNAVGEVLKTKPGWKIYCMQGATRDAVSNFFPETSSITTAANAEGLALKIIAAAEAGLVFFCGGQRLDTLPGLLDKNNIAVEEIVAYNTELTPRKTNSAEGILFFSTSAVKSYLSMNLPSPDTVCFAIGETTAMALRDALPNRIIVAEEPGKNAIVNLVIKYYNEHN